LQVHHLLQLNADDKPRITRVDELAVVCANCHLLLHLNPRRAIQPSTLRAMLENQRPR
jgi:predicted HNH restriction endonuclease